MPVPVGYTEVTIPARYGGAQPYGAVVFGIDSGLTSDPSALADQIWTTAFSPNLLPLLDDSVLWGPIEVSIGEAAGDLSGVGALSGNGGASIVSVPPNAAVLVSKATASGGRRNRGRMYWPWAANEADVSETGSWNPLSVANFQSAMDSFLADLDTGAGPMVILHRDGSVPTAVTQLNVQSLLATQRRRLRR